MTFSNPKPVKAKTVRVGLAALFWACGAWLGAQVLPESRPTDAKPIPRNFDSRRVLNRDYETQPTETQRQAVARLREKYPELFAGYDRYSGVTRTLYRVNGYLTPPSTRDALDLGLSFVEENLDVFGLSPLDLAEIEVTDRVFSKVTGATHLYLRQRFGDIPVYNGQLHLNVNREGRLIGVNNAFVPGLAGSVRVTAPVLPAAKAVIVAADHLGVVVASQPVVLEQEENEVRTTRLEARGFSAEPVEASLTWFPVRRGDTRLSWNFRIATLDGQHFYDINVDAESGEVLSRFDWVADADYKVYPSPVESPNHTSPSPPADGRVTVFDPADADASPLGWHDTDGSAGPEFTILRGNNAHAYLDLFDTGTPPGVQPDGGPGLSFDFPLDLTLAPEDNEDPAVANLFYWNNIIHDITHRYGFDEAGGNFQTNNYGNGGLGNDYVRAEAQDGRDVGNTNNAFFFTPPDGNRPRMEMYVFNATSPRRDGDFDSGIICHEYGHGISNRLIGGPSNVSCLQNFQQPGEGISDWWALVLTHRPGQLGPDPRGMGTYVLGQATDGPGIRPQRYSTDPAVNNYTYETIRSFGSSHSIGSVWAQAAWEVYWALVDEYGYDPDFYNAMGGSGNQRMMLYMVEGFKNTACSPTFAEVRDGIVQAAMDNYGGEDVCLVWEAFAAFGLGLDADPANPNSVNVTNGFGVPAFCSCTPPPDPQGLTAGLTIANEVALSWNGGGGTYTVLRSETGCFSEDFQEIATGLNQGEYTDTAVVPGVTYSYRVVAASGPCQSQPSHCETVFVCGDFLTLTPLWQQGVTVLNLISCL